MTHRKSSAHDREPRWIALAISEPSRAEDEDLESLTRALAGEGMIPTVSRWDDPTADWSRVDAVLVESTWDYPRRAAEFLEWAREVDRRTVLLNPLAAVEWNIDKRYLHELADDGIPTVASRRSVPGRRWNRDSGETSLIHIGGRYSHAMHNSALLSQGAGTGDGLFRGGEFNPRTPTRVERTRADDVLAAVTKRFGTPAYARTDLIPDQDGNPLVLECELIEPVLFLHRHPAAATELAATINDHLTGQARPPEPRSRRRGVVRAPFPAR